MLQFLKRYDVVYVLSIVALWLSTFLAPTGPLSADVKATDAGKLTLDYLSELSKLAVTLNSGLYSACALVAIKGREWSTAWTRLDGYAVVAAIVCGACSYFGTYATYTGIAEMVYVGVVDPFSARIQWGLSLQYYGFLTGVFFIGLVFCRMLESRKST
jgi:hypothetical protein